MYEVVARRDWKSNDNPASIFANFIPTNQQFANTDSALALTSTQLGVTPFDCPAFCELWKIVKVRRIKLEDGATATLQFRDPKHRKMEYDIISNKSALRGVTRAWVPIVYGVPNANRGAPLRAESVKPVSHFSDRVDAARMFRVPMVRRYGYRPYANILSLVPVYLDALPNALVVK
ncbi:hypothetical protein AXG93_1101s1000 [Marchantia polymorpha subsp. ruderalis]|uniref:Uncharacterized protein n=1 Tax=Marchantia polymorpha subsp. ruderalis TaxID=1480154 RepID=A0A176W2X6_MARPO|nr:hypothetical protein AXG93_1101s1000 [Marchantia polymorpha subsp. ruderalis]